MNELLTKSVTPQKEMWLFANQIAGHIAMWSVRQSPYHNPDNLSSVLDIFQEKIASKFDKNGMCPLSRESLKKLLVEELLTIPQVVAWNEPKSKHHAPFLFVSAFTRARPDDDFIDLDALVANTVRSVSLEYESY